ncbi:MAG: class IV adenylate cyclase [Methanosarcinaceae archaeon]|nr:class IV adenylate cyclase [Methanosarcinaceae archaeon]
MIEVEVKVYASHDRIKELFKNKENDFKQIQYINTEIQNDQYFNDPNRDFAKTNEALRIRTINDESEITYKGNMLDDVSKTRPEFNSPVDKYNMTQILLSLGYVLSDTVEKTREIHKYEDMTLCFDNVKGIGEFLEIEIGLEDDSSKKEITEATNRIFEFLKTLGIEREKSERKSYLELIIEKREKQAVKT